VHEPGERPRSDDRALVWSTRALVAFGALTIFAGTAATAAGPHAGGNAGEHINRLDFDGRGTMDFVIHRHAEAALAFSLFAVLVWWLARRRSADPLVRRSTTVLCAVLALQGAVGLDQYETHLPTELVWVHVALACAAWLAALWAAYAAGRLSSDRRSADAGRDSPSADAGGHSPAARVPAASAGAAVTRERSEAPPPMRV
jgi:heme a synthase